MARLEAIDTILEDAEPYDVLMVCAHAFAHAMPLCCEKHEDEFKAEFLRVLSDCIARSGTRSKPRLRRKGRGTMRSSAGALRKSLKVYTITLERISTGERAGSMVTRQASEDAARPMRRTPSGAHPSRTICELWK